MAKPEGDNTIPENVAEEVKAETAENNAAPEGEGAKQEEVKTFVKMSHRTDNETGAVVYHLAFGEGGKEVSLLRDRFKKPILQGSKMTFNAAEIIRDYPKVAEDLIGAGLFERFGQNTLSQAITKAQEQRIPQVEKQELAKMSADKRSAAIQERYPLTEADILSAMKATQGYAEDIMQGRKAISYGGTGGNSPTALLVGLGFSPALVKYLGMQSASRYHANRFKKQRDEFNALWLPVCNDKSEQTRIKMLYEGLTELAQPLQAEFIDLCERWHAHWARQQQAEMEVDVFTLVDNK